jgi:hypothetical protein
MRVRGLTFSGGRVTQLPYSSSVWLVERCILCEIMVAQHLLNLAISSILQSG